MGLGGGIEGGGWGLGDGGGGGGARKGETIPILRRVGYIVINGRLICLAREGGGGVNIPHTHTRVGVTRAGFVQLFRETIV